MQINMYTYFSISITISRNKVFLFSFSFIWFQSTVEARYIAVQYKTMLHIGRAGEGKFIRDIFELIIDTPYLVLTGELWCVYYEYFNKRDRDISSLHCILYVIVIFRWFINVDTHQSYRLHKLQVQEFMQEHQTESDCEVFISIYSVNVEVLYWSVFDILVTFTCI